MRITRNWIAGALLGLSFVAACRGSDNKDNPDAPTVPTDGSGSGAIRIQDVQSDAMADGTAVELRGVVVTAVDKYGDSTGNFWVQDSGGGPFSGIKVFGAPGTAVASLAVGDLVDITGGAKREFKFTNSKGSITEIQAPKGGSLTITKKGAGPMPVPAVVDVLAIGIKATEAERYAEWEKWEGVLITATNVVAFDDPSCILSQKACKDPTWTNAPITGLAKLESALVPLPTLKGGDCLATVAGVVDYAFDFVVLPRSEADVVTGGTGCVRETGTANFCADSLDNDGNGFKDCDDFSCVTGPGAWLGATCAPADAMCGCSKNLPLGMSVNKVNTGATGAVLMHDVFVTAVGTTGFWVADALQAGPSGGVFVFTNTAPAAEIVVGAKVATVQGTVATLGTLTEKLVEITNATAGAASVGGTVLPLVSDATTLSALVAGRPLAGSLVQLKSVRVTAIDPTTKRVTLREDGGATVTMDDNIFADYTDAVPTMGTCYATVTGIMDLQTTDQVRLLNPRSAADFDTTDAVCAP